MKLYDSIVGVVVACTVCFNLPAQGPAVDDTAKGRAEERLAKSAAALQSFRRSASEATRALLDQALCVGVAPRRDPAEIAADAKGFVICRPTRSGVWSNPAAIVIQGGGVFWPVFGSRIDVFLLTANPSTASHFGDALVPLGAELATTPGGVRLDRFPLRIGDPVIFVFEQSPSGITGINIAGAVMTEDRIANAVLYGNEVNNLAILKRDSGMRRSTAVELFLAALSSSGSEFGTGVAEQ